MTSAPVEPGHAGPQLALVAAAQVLALTTWFAASAAAPALQAEWRLSGAQVPLLTTAVQLGFVVGALASAGLNLPDRLPAPRLMAAGALGAALTTGCFAGLVDDLEPAVVLRFLTGVSLAAVGALTLGSTLPQLIGGSLGEHWRASLGGYGWTGGPRRGAGVVHAARAVPRPGHPAPTGRDRVVAQAARTPSGQSRLLLAAAMFGQPLALLLPVLVVWGITVIADSAMFSACTTQVVDAPYVGTALTFQTAVGSLVTVITIQTVPLVAEAAGWPLAVALLAIGPLLGAFAMLRLSPLLSSTDHPKENPCPPGRTERPESATAPR